MKKSQVSVFIIIGVLLVIIVAVFVFLDMRSKEVEQKDDLSLYSDKSLVVRSYVDDCLSSELDNALEYVSLQGGYVYRPELSLERDYYNIAYDYYLGLNFLPHSQEVADEEIAVYLEEYIPRCLNQKGLLDQEFVSLGEMSLDTNIDDYFVQVDLDYPITITTDEEQETLNRFVSKKDVPLGHMLNTAHDVIENIREDPNWINIGYLESLGMDVEVIHIDKNTIVYKLNDPFVKFKGGPYFFMFGALYTENSPPDLFTFNDYTVNIGEVLEVYPYAIDFNGDALTYSADTNLVDVDSTSGLVTFNPVVKGEFVFNIKVDDGFGMTDEEELRVKVI